VYLPLKNKKITNLYCGINSFFAYETKTIPPIDTWTNADIVKWAKDNKDLNDYANILRFENVSGKALLRADKAYLIDKLGVTLEDLQVKFLNAIKDVSIEQISEINIFAWGNNSSGQLGIEHDKLNITQPKMVHLPPFKKDNYITEVFCGLKQTVFMTKQGHLLITPLRKQSKPELANKEAGGKEKGKKKEQVVEEKPKVSNDLIDITNLFKAIKGD